MSGVAQQSEKTALLTLHKLKFHMDLQGVYVRVEIKLDPVHQVQTWETYSAVPLKICGSDECERDEYDFYLTRVTMPIGVAPIIEEGATR